MASQISACQRRKGFITPLKGASLYWLFVLVCSLRHEAGASGSLLPSFCRDFALLFCSAPWTFPHSLPGAGRGSGLGPRAAMASSLPSLLLMERGSLPMNWLSPIKASATTTKPRWAAAQRPFPSRLSTAGFRRAVERIAWGSLLL